MNKAQKIALIALAIVGIGVVLAWQQSKDFRSVSGCCAGVDTLATLQPNQTHTVEPTASTTGTTSQKLPRLLDLGAGKCIPCKMMAPILEELKKEYAGRMEVAFIDVWKNPEMGNKYGIQMIPTQIFYDADGKELYRHSGFFTKEDILAKWSELKIDLNGSRT